MAIITKALWKKTPFQSDIVQWPEWLLWQVIYQASFIWFLKDFRHTASLREFSCPSGQQIHLYQLLKVCSCFILQIACYIMGSWCFRFLDTSSVQVNNFSQDKDMTQVLCLWPEIRTLHFQFLVLQDIDYERGFQL